MPLTRPSLPTRRTMGILTVLGALVVAVLAVVPAVDAAESGSTGSFAFRNDPAVTDRVNANDGVSAAVATSRMRYGNGQAPHVFIARGDTHVDALTSSSLLRWGPLLFVNRDGVPAATADEIRRVLEPGGTVHILGGTIAVATQVEADIRNYGNVGTVARLDGDDRFHTATLVADLLVDFRANDPAFRTADPKGVLIARAHATPGDHTGTSGWADAIAAGASAAYRSQPILLSRHDQTQLAPRTSQWIQRHPVTEATLLGGPVALPQGLTTPGETFRVAGPERAATAGLLGPAFHGQHAPDDYRKFMLINGYHRDGWAFGLAAAGLAADSGAPLLLVGSSEVPDSTADLLRGCNGHHVETLFIGGDQLIPATVRSQVEALDNSCPAGRYGSNRELDHACHAFSWDEVRDLQPNGRDTFLSRERDEDYWRSTSVSSCYFKVDREATDGVATVGNWFEINTADRGATPDSPRETFIRDVCADEAGSDPRISVVSVNGADGCLTEVAPGTFSSSAVDWQRGLTLHGLSFDPSREVRAGLVYSRRADARLR